MGTRASRSRLLLPSGIHEAAPVSVFLEGKHFRGSTSIGSSCHPFDNAMGAYLPQAILILNKEARMCFCTIMTHCSSECRARFLLVEGAYGFEFKDGVYKYSSA